MPKNRKKKQAFRKANIGTIPISSASVTTNNANQDRCEKCNRSLAGSYFTIGQLCLNCIRICGREKLFAKKQSMPQYVTLNPIDFSERGNEIHQNNNSRKVWQRKVYPTPPHLLNRNRNVGIIHPTVESYEAPFNPNHGHQNISPSMFSPQQHSPYFQSNMKTYTPIQHPNLPPKRKREPDASSSKRFRPNSHSGTPSLFTQQRPHYDEPAEGVYSVSSHKLQRRDISLGPTLSLPPNASQQFHQLSANIWNYFHENCQTDEIFEAKMALRSHIQRIIQTKFRSDLFVFGSSMTGFATKNSDIDMCLMFHDEQIQRKRTMKILYELRYLFQRYGFRKLEVIPAKVPIVKFRDPANGFDIDLNINNPTGIRNSQLLRSYARTDPRVRPLVLGVKFWARFHKINDAKINTLSSYSLGLMLIHFLQYRCSPPVLPPLQIMQPDKYLPDSDVRTLEIDEELPVFKSKNGLNVGELFAGFLRYYASEYNYETSRISVRLGRVLPREDLKLNKRNELAVWIDIEEPFERVNVARSTNNPDKSAYIKSVFDSSADLIHSENVFML